MPNYYYYLKTFFMDQVPRRDLVSRPNITASRGRKIAGYCLSLLAGTLQYFQYNNCIIAIPISRYIAIFCNAIYIREIFGGQNCNILQAGTDFSLAGTGGSGRDEIDNAYDIFR